MRRHITAWTAFAVLLAAGGSPALAEVRRLSFTVRGMVCPLCTRGVEESIKRLRGVSGVRAELASGRVEVEAQVGQSLNIEEVRQRAARAGFAAYGDTEVLARGRFTIGTEGRITFRVAGSTYAWQVLESQQLLALFRASPTLKGDYLVGFRLHELASSTHPALALISVEPAAWPVERAAGP